MQQQSIEACRSHYQWMWGSSARPCGASGEAETLLLSQGTQSVQLARRLDHTHLHHSHPAQVSLLFGIMLVRKQDWAASAGLMRGRDGSRGTAACCFVDRIQAQRSSHMRKQVARSSTVVHNLQARLSSCVCKIQQVPSIACQSHKLTHAAECEDTSKGRSACLRLWPLLVCWSACQAEDCPLVSVDRTLLRVGPAPGGKGSPLSFQAW